MDTVVMTANYSYWRYQTPNDLAFWRKLGFKVEVFYPNGHNWMLLKIAKE